MEKLSEGTTVKGDAMSLKRFVRGLFGLVQLLGVAAPLYAQGMGAIGGTVTDPSGGVLPGVMVTLSSAAGGVGSNQTTLTSDQGA